MSLVEVPSDQFDAFAAGLVEFLPHSYQIEGMLRGHLKYNYFTIFDVKLYAPMDPVHRHHMAVITPTGTAKELKSMSIFWDENQISDDDMYHLLRTLPVDSWDHPYMIRQIPLHLQPKMDALVLRLTEGRSHLLMPIPIITMTLAPEDLPPVPQLPEGYYFGDLAASYSEEILSRWVGASTENVKVYSKLLVTLPSVAIYYRGEPNSPAADNDELCELSATKGHGRGELASYSIYKHSADTGITFTKESHRRKGLARAVTLQLAERLRQDGIRSYVVTDNDNELSIDMHSKIGFKRYTEAAIPFYIPEGFDFTSIPNFFTHEDYRDIIKKWEESFTPKSV